MLSFTYWTRSGALWPSIAKTTPPNKCKLLIANDTKSSRSSLAPSMYCSSNT